MPAMEFARINGAEMPEAWRVPVQPKKSKRGVRNIPPPVPLKPDSKPMAPPTKRAVYGEGVLVCCCSFSLGVMNVSVR